MRNILKYSALIFCSALLLIGHSPYISIKLYNTLNNGLGDLYKKSNLTAFKYKRETCGEKFTNSNKPGGTNLFLIGDSFFEGLYNNSAGFKNVDNVYFVHWQKQLTIPELPKNARNILVYESVERYLFAKYDTANIVINPAVKEFTYDNPISSKGFTKIMSIESNEFTLNLILFMDKFSLWVKDFKGDFNYKYFNRLDENIQLSTDKKYLFNYAEINGTSSSFEKIRPGYLDTTVNYFNNHYQHYKRMGFNEIYLTVIPNKVSVIAPTFDNKQYNHFADQIKNSPKLQVPFIDIYAQMKAANETKEIFFRNDTHWNCAGQQVFIDYLNNTVLSKQPQN